MSLDDLTVSPQALDPATFSGPEPRFMTAREMMNLIDKSDERHFVAELETGFVSFSSKRQYFRGYCFFACKMVANELHQMPADFRARHLVEMSVVAEAVQNAFGAKKMNVAYLGNSLPQVHWNIIPRYGSDPIPHDAIWCIDRDIVESVIFSDDELDVMRQELIAELVRLAGRYGIPVQSRLV